MFDLGGESYGKLNFV